MAPVQNNVNRHPPSASLTSDRHPNAVDAHDAHHHVKNLNIHDKLMAAWHLEDLQIKQEQGWTDDQSAQHISGELTGRLNNTQPLQLNSEAEAREYITRHIPQKDIQDFAVSLLFLPPDVANEMTVRLLSDTCTHLSSLSGRSSALIERMGISGVARMTGLRREAEISRFLTLVEQDHDTENSPGYARALDEILDNSEDYASQEQIHQLASAEGVTDRVHLAALTYWQAHA